MSTANEISLNDWLEATITAAEEFAQTALGFDDVSLLRTHENFPVGEGSAFLALVGEDTSIQLGIASDYECFHQLARALLGMEPDEEDLEEPDIADAIGEVTNILAGQVKTIMSNKSVTMNLGMPMFVKGGIYLKEGTERAVAEMVLGSIPVMLIVLRKQNIQA